MNKREGERGSLLVAARFLKGLRIARVFGCGLVLLVPADRTDACRAPAIAG